MTAETLPARAAPVERRPEWWGLGAVLVVPLLSVVGIAGASGGFNPTSFGWTALAFAWVVIVAVAVSAPAWGAFDLAWIGAAAALCLYTFVSALWSDSVAIALNNGQRSLEYLVGVVVALLLASRGRISIWLAALALGATAVSVYSLATRLYPDHFGAFNADAGYRLFVPIGYWNALGIFAAIGALLGLGVAVSARGRVLRLLTATGLVPLTATMYFTFSRGATIALGIGLLAMMAISPRRLRLLGGVLALVPVPAVGVLLASRSGALTHQSVALAAATHAGHRLALEFALLAVVQVVAAAVYVFWLSNVGIGSSARRLAGGLAIAAAVLALLAVFVAYGSPTAITRHAYDSFVSTPTGGSDLNSHLLSLSNNGRTVLWHSALADFRAHPVVGSGAGSFGRWWLAHRTSGYFVEDAHNLYLQTLAEGGVIGLVLLIALLAIPLVAAVRARRHPLVAPAFGAYVAFLVHAAADWDWQMPAVTLLALFTAAVLVAAARGRQPRRAVPRRLRIVLGVVMGVVVVVAFVGLIGNIALANAQSGILNRSGLKAVADAEKAHRWAPWSAVALRALGESRLLVGQRRAGVEALRGSAAKDPGDWQTWYDLAAVTTGAERKVALTRARALNRHAPELETAALQIR